MYFSRRAWSLASCFFMASRRLSFPARSFSKAFCFLASTLSESRLSSSSQRFSRAAIRASRLAMRSLRLASCSSLRFCLGSTVGTASGSLSGVAVTAVLSVCAAASASAARVSAAAGKSCWASESSTDSESARASESLSLMLSLRLDTGASATALGFGSLARESRLAISLRILGM